MPCRCSNRCATSLQWLIDQSCQGGHTQCIVIASVQGRPFIFDPSSSSDVQSNSSDHCRHEQRCAHVQENTTLRLSWAVETDSMSPSGWDISMAHPCALTYFYKKKTEEGWEMLFFPWSWASTNPPIMTWKSIITDHRGPHCPHTEEHSPNQPFLSLQVRSDTEGSEITDLSSTKICQAFHFRTTVEFLCPLFGTFACENVALACCSAVLQEQEEMEKSLECLTC